MQAALPPPFPAVDGGRKAEDGRGAPTSAFRLPPPDWRGEHDRGINARRTSRAPASASAATSSGRTLEPPTPIATRSSAQATISATTPTAGHTTHTATKIGASSASDHAPRNPAATPSPRARSSAPTAPLTPSPSPLRGKRTTYGLIWRQAPPAHSRREVRRRRLLS